jgi:hypothetical protein
MTSEMNVLIEQLQEAVDEAISDSGRINAIVAEIKRSGFDLCLVVESNVAISPIEGAQPPDSVPDPRLMSSGYASTGEIELTAQDLAFLQELKIALPA